MNKLYTRDYNLRWIDPNPKWRLLYTLIPVRYVALNGLSHVVGPVSQGDWQEYVQ